MALMESVIAVAKTKPARAAPLSDIVCSFRRTLLRIRFPVKKTTIRNFGVREPGLVALPAKSFAVIAGVNTAVSPWKSSMSADTLRHSSCRRFRCNQFPNLGNGVVDLHLNGELADFRSRRPGIARNAVINARELGIRPLTGRQYRIADGCFIDIAHPKLRLGLQV